jgi:16S rRNA (cytosine967-C5)-methyltransferase
VLLDAPCSATGTIRRHPDVAYLKKPEDIAGLAALQRRMLARAASFLRPGGTLVYCTCSLEPEEGEAHLAALADLPLALDPVEAREVGGLAEIVTGEGAIRTLPSHLPNAEDPRLGGLDGFFIMRLRKRG